MGVFFFFFFFKNVYKENNHPKKNSKPFKSISIGAQYVTLQKKNISYIQVLVNNFFPTPPIKLKLEPWVGERLLIATHLDQSSYSTI
jgi:hypothetical protein